MISSEEVLISFLKRRVVIEVSFEMEHNWNDDILMTVACWLMYEGRNKVLSIQMCKW